MQLTVSNRLDKEGQVVNLDATKISNFILAFAVLSFFVHLMLHHCSNFQQNIEERLNSIGDYKDIIRKLEQQDIPSKTIAGGKKKDTAIESKPIVIKKTPTETKISRIQNDQGLASVSLAAVQKKLNVKRIGNITVISMKTGDTLSEALNAAGFSGKKSHLISNAISKKYKVSQIKDGDLLQIIKLSGDKEKFDNIKIIIAQKTSILIKGDEKQYNVLVHRIEDNMRKKVDIFTAKKATKNQLQKLQFTTSNFGQTIKQAAISSDVKRDLMSIINMIKQDSKFKNDVFNIEILYERVSSKASNLFYVDIQNSKSKVRVYRYADKSGIVKYVQQNGVILAKKPKTLQTTNFKISYPLHKPVVGSGFGMRLHPILHKHRMHKGIDLKAKKGTPIYAPADGIILDVTTCRGFGKYIRIRHNSTYTTLYGHLDRFANVRVGTKVSKGEVIGYVGKSGLASGEHLHFEVHENGRAINPSKLISNTTAVKSNATQKLNSKQMSAFREYKASIEKRML